MYIRDAMRLLRGPPSRQQRPSLLPHDCTLHPTSRIETLGPKHEEQASSASSRSHARSRYDSSEEYCTFTRTGTLALALLVHFPSASHAPMASCLRRPHVSFRCTYAPQAKRRQSQQRLRSRDRLRPPALSGALPLAVPGLIKRRGWRAARFLHRFTA